jgi:hypothetical protein
MKLLKKLGLVLLLATPLPALAEGIAGKLYKHPACSCCEEYAKYLNNNGYDIDVVISKDIPAIKEEHGVPVQVASCHTTIVGDYAVEGHVPVESIDRLLSEQPDVKGIGVPGMPAGSPGMGGRKTAPLVVYAFTGSGEVQPYETH